MNPWLAFSTTSVEEWRAVDDHRLGRGREVRSEYVLIHQTVLPRSMFLQPG
jgi:hypothetical protein